MPAGAKELFDASVDQVRRGQVRTALDTLLQTLALDPAHAGALDAAARICRLLGAPEDARLFDAVASHPRDALALYDLGYRLVDQDRPVTAAALLERSLSLGGDPANVRRELAYARLQAADFRGALRALAPLEHDDQLSETERLEVLLTQSEAAFYAHQRERAAAWLSEAEQLIPDDSQRERLDALHAQVGRSLRWPSLEAIGLREWHFIQHAGVLLKTAGGWFEDGSRRGRFDVLDLRLDMVAFLAQRLLDLLDRLGLPFDVTVPASELAAPLAHGLAQRAERRCVPDLESASGEQALLVAASAAELAPLSAELALNRPELRVFALSLDWERDAPVCPEVCGVLARRALLPWEARFAINESGNRMREVPGDRRNPAEIGSDLALAMAALPDDGGVSREEFEAFYMPLASTLLLGNDGLHPSRRRFTHLSPLPTGPVLSSGDDAAAFDDDAPPDGR
ncbi:MAG: tetratricopeptide repeat protein [Planctomycetota bacterium]